MGCCVMCVYECVGMRSLKSPLHTLLPAVLYLFLSFPLSFFSLLPSSRPLRPSSVSTLVFMGGTLFGGGGLNKASGCSPSQLAFWAGCGAGLDKYRNRVENYSKMSFNIRCIPYSTAYVTVYYCLVSDISFNETLEQIEKGVF